jgi:hypothetical protein
MPEFNSVILRQSSTAGLVPDPVEVLQGELAVNLADRRLYSKNATGSVIPISADPRMYAVFTPLDAQPPASNFATIDTRNSISVLDFDAATSESTVFVGVMPETAVLGSGIKVRLHWAATSATSGNCVWGVQLERMNTDMDSDSFATAVTATSVTNGTSGIPTVTELTVATIDGLLAGEPYRLKVYRDAANGSDTMTGDAELVAVEVRSAA